MARAAHRGWDDRGGRLCPKGRIRPVMMTIAADVTGPLPIMGNAGAVQSPPRPRAELPDYEVKVIFDRVP